MRASREIIIISILVFVFWLLEYLYFVVPRPYRDYRIGFLIICDENIRFDAYVYNACVKAQHFITVWIVHLRMNMKPATKYLLFSFGLCFLEYFITYNEPFFTLPLPEIGIFHPYIPMSTTTLKFAAVCYFMTECIRSVWIWRW